MHPAPLPANEKERQQATLDLKLLDTPPEERFDRLTRLATKLFSVPIAAVTLIDAQREWFKSCQGLGVREGQRAISFCGHAIVADNELIIADTKRDPRFADNPMVIGPPHIRFYAGIPLHNVAGVKVGVFCIKDRRPRHLTKEQSEILRILATCAEEELYVHNLNLAVAEHQKIDQVKNEFLAIASHQLRAPLTSTRWYVELLLNKKAGPLTTKQIAYLKEVDLGTSRLIELVKTFLDTSRLELGALAFETRPTDLPRLIQEIIEENGRLIADKRLILKQKYYRPLPRPLTDPRLIKTVLQNLFGNAIKYTPRGGRISVVLRRQPDGAILCTVSDTGHGIPLEHHDQIYKKFFRAHNIKRRHPDGTGLGLFIAKSILEQLGGRIWFKSALNRGSHFYALIPHRASLVNQSKTKGLTKRKNNKKIK